VIGIVVGKKNRIEVKESHSTLMIPQGSYNLPRLISAGTKSLPIQTRRAIGIAYDICYPIVAREVIDMNASAVAKFRSMNIESKRKVNKIAPAGALLPSVTHLIHEDNGNASSLAKAYAIRVVTVRELMPLNYMLIVSTIITPKAMSLVEHCNMMSETPRKLFYTLSNWFAVGSSSPMSYISPIAAVPRQHQMMPMGAAMRLLEVSSAMWPAAS